MTWPAAPRRNGQAGGAPHADLNRKASDGQPTLFDTHRHHAFFTTVDAAVTAYNLTRAAGILAAGPFGKARTGTIRRKLIHVPARIATSARRIRLHLPEAWPWKTAWEELFTIVHAPPEGA